MSPATWSHQPEATPPPPPHPTPPHPTPTQPTNINLQDTHWLICKYHIMLMCVMHAGLANYQNTAKLTSPSPDIVHQCYNCTEQHLTILFYSVFSLIMQLRRLYNYKLHSIIQGNEYRWLEWDATCTTVCKAFGAYDGSHIVASKLTHISWAGTWSMPKFQYSYWAVLLSRRRHS